jgi:anti-sigma factor ChrR (cupin superfamily)
MTSCHDVQARLSDYIDGTMTGGDRAAVAAHLETCAACRAIAQDLERIRGTARALGPLAPPDHVWLEVAGQIQLASPAQAPADRTAARREVWQWIGLAAALVVVTLGAYVVVRVRTPAPDATAFDASGGGNAAASGSVEGIEQELKIAEEHYDKAIGQLEAIVKSNDASIDPVTAAVLQKNLPVMDQAIAESRAALSGSPTDQAARASLFEALRQKVSVLQDTVALMNEMRKGNQEGAARVAAGMGKS